MAKTINPPSTDLIHSKIVVKGLVDAGLTTWKPKHTRSSTWPAITLPIPRMWAGGTQFGVGVRTKGVLNLKELSWFPESEGEFYPLYCHSRILRNRIVLWDFLGLRVEIRNEVNLLKCTCWGLWRVARRWNATWSNVFN